MSQEGVNWHNTINTSPIPLGALLNLQTGQAGNIGWLGASSANAGTICVGFNNNVTVPVNGTASATDGWPLSAGGTLPVLTGECEDLGKSLYAAASTMDQDLFVIGYAPCQMIAPTATLTGNLVLEDGATFVVLEDGTTMIGLEP